MIDFSNAKEIFNTYKGSEKKKTLIYNEKKYLVKFPDPIREKNKEISYINNVYSEYIGSNIFKICGFKAQTVILGKYNYNGIDKIVCACEDFTDENNTLCEFENMALSFELDKKIGTEIEDIINVLKENSYLINFEEIKNRFYNMFIIDSLIGNADRHNGNWGFIYNIKEGKIIFSPIFDCGSCLNPLLTDDEIINLKESEIKNLAINCYSCLKANDKKINYISYIKSMSNKECIYALQRIFKHIKIDEIIKFIDSIEIISNERKKFYKQIILIRYDILKYLYNSISM